MAPYEPDHGRQRRGGLLTLNPTVDLRIGQPEQLLECHQTRIVETAKFRFGETPENQIQFLRAAMMRTIKRAFYPGLYSCHGEICADGLWMSEPTNARRWPDDPQP